MPNADTSICCALYAKPEKLADFQQVLLEAASGPSGIVLDISQLESVHSGLLQMVWAAALYCRTQQRPFTLFGQNTVWTEAVQLLDLDALHAGEEGRV